MLGELEKEVKYFITSFYIVTRGCPSINLGLFIEGVEKGLKNSLKPSLEPWKIKNSIGSVVIEIFSFIQKNLLLYTLGLLKNQPIEFYR